MAKLARQGSHDLRVRQLALDLTQRLTGKDWEGETSTIFDYVKNTCRYVRDIRDTDTLHYPATILSIQAGDCDDMAILLAALLLSIGHDLQFVALAQDGQNWGHVWVRDLTSGRPLDLDATEALPFGAHVIYAPSAKTLVLDIDKI